MWELCCILKEIRDVLKEILEAMKTTTNKRRNETK